MQLLTLRHTAAWDNEVAEQPFRTPRGNFYLPPEQLFMCAIAVFDLVDAAFLHFQQRFLVEFVKRAMAAEAHYDAVTGRPARAAIARASSSGR